MKESKDLNKLISLAHQNCKNGKLKEAENLYIEILNLGVKDPDMTVEMV